MGTQRPYYRRPVRSLEKEAKDFSSGGKYIDLKNVLLPAYETEEPVLKTQELVDDRAAACLSATVALHGVGDDGPVRIWPPVPWTNNGPRRPPKVPFEPVKEPTLFWARDLLEVKHYSRKVRSVYLPTRKSLAALAYLDFFPAERRVGTGLRSMVSAAILASDAGWCGTFGPLVTGGMLGAFTLGSGDGNYDMTQMHLIAVAYSYYDAISPDAREHLIEQLLARGQMNRPNLDATFTSGRAPSDWHSAGYVKLDVDFLGVLPAYRKHIDETENHILMIATARYLTNQLLFQRHKDDKYDNRRNASEGAASCTEILLSLLQNILRDDFSEYNAKPYQQETRWALLNLCTFAYDHEIRLAARMVLDYVSAHIAVSSNELRRMVPFRRRNESPYAAHNAAGSMTIPLVGGAPGEDPMTAHFTLQTGNTRAYEAEAEAAHWKISGTGDGLVLEVVSDYRLPNAIHDLFVNDLHRRFFQRLRRTPRPDNRGGNRNCDNMEIYASSPSYLITAGGSPSDYAIDPRTTALKIVVGDQRQQLGVAVTTSIMRTGSGYGPHPETDAGSLIQLSTFLEGHRPDSNYGVAPDFACGHNLQLPGWANVRPRKDERGEAVEDGFVFLNRGVFERRDELQLTRERERGPGFYLAVYQSGELAVLEAFDTWLHPGVSFKDFQTGVITRNGGLRLEWNQEFEYTTWNGNRLHALIWRGPSARWRGAEVTKVEYGDVDLTDALRAAMAPGSPHTIADDAGRKIIGDAGNNLTGFLSGTVMNSPADAVVEITNPFLRTKITLDMSKLWHPRRISDTGEVETAGSNHEVWLDFEADAPGEGDVCRPFSTIAAAAGAVADRGAIRVVPGTTIERPTLGSGGKRLRLVAPIGGVVIGARRRSDVPYSSIDGAGEAVRKDDVWVQFDMPDFALRGPFNNLAAACSAVTDRGTIRIVPGVTGEKAVLGKAGKRFTLVAPIGGVTIGRGIWA